MCFSATSSLMAGAFAYGVAGFVYRKQDPRLKWGAVALVGITAMQWVEGLLWMSDPSDCGTIDQLLTVVAIPLALLAQPWGPLIGSTWAVPTGPRRGLIALLGVSALVMVLGARANHQPICTAVTPEGYLNWWSPTNPPEFWLPSYSLWAMVIGAPFLLWWRPRWQAPVIVSWGWLCATLSFMYTDSAASNWCFFVSFYALFLFAYAALAGSGSRTRAT
ncbi:MAG: hypothetical protein ACI8PZ_007073 [Myxococcota bacterium]|jgi:hypothetical protein